MVEYYNIKYQNEGCNLKNCLNCWVCIITPIFDKSKTFLAIVYKENQTIMYYSK